MNNPVNSLRWKEFLETLCQTLNINIGIVDGSGNLLISFFKTRNIEMKEHYRLFNDYKSFFLEAINSLESGPNIYSDLLGLLFSIILLDDKNYLILVGVQEKNTDFNQDELIKKLNKYGINDNYNIFLDNIVLLNRKELELKTIDIKNLYNQLFNITRDRDELGQNNAFDCSGRIQ